MAIALLGVNSIMMENLAEPGEGEGCAPLRTKLWCTLQLAGTVPLFLIYPNMTLCLKPPCTGSE
jgi:hypothetical protein